MKQVLLNFLKFGLSAILLVHIGYAQTANINLNSERQLIRGFGGINVPGWIDDLTPEQAQLAFGNGEGEMGMSILRVRISPESSQWQREVRTAEIARDNGAIIFATPWSPPNEMKLNERDASRYVGGYLNPSYYVQYAQHLKAFCDFMRSEGVPLYAVSIQNEPDYHVDYESCDWTGQQFVNFLNEARRYMGEEKVIVGESFQYLKNLTDPILSSNATDKFDIVGAHIYGTSLNNFSYPNGWNSGKELWMTEHYTESDNDADRWPLAHDVSYEIHNCMVEAQFSAYVWWYIRRSYGLIKENGQISKRGYCMSQFSKFIRPGAYRVDATKNPTSNVYVSAYKKDSDVTIVAVNRGTSSATVTFNISGGNVSSMQKYVTSSNKNIEKGTDVSVSNGSFTVTLEPQSTTTFVDRAPVEAPIVSISSPTNRIVAVGETVNIQATVEDISNDVTLVEFFVNDEKIGEDATAPYSISWIAESEGEFRVTARATDALANTGTGGIVLEARAPQAPYGGTPHAIPGKIEFEEFDTGGQDSAYYDTSSGSETGVAFRDIEDVDIENCEDIGGGYNLGWTVSGEWLEYTVNVEEAGIYTMDIRVANSGTGKALSFEINGNPMALDISIPNTGDWQAWETVSINNIELSSGVQIMRVTVSGENYVNMNHVTFALASPLDECPNDPNKTSPGECGCGTPDIDSDNDLVFNCHDLCPNDPNKTEPGECGCGVSEGSCSNDFITLHAGWNLIGCPLEENISVNEGLQSIWEYVSVIKNMNEFYNKDYPEQLNLLTHLQFGMGYFVWVSEDCNLIW